MEFLKDSILKDRRVLLAGGGGLALAAGLVLAVIIGSAGGRPGAPPASQGGLVIQTGRDDDIKLDPKRPLRCFVNGQFVGEVPLEDCAKQNGVATGALDVGLDPSGALAASNGASTDITPLPPQPETPVHPVAAPTPAPTTQPTAEPEARAQLTGDCWRYGGGSWARIASDMTLNTCVQSLYAGRCEKGANAAYGRWIDQTLRLNRGRIEVSGDNHSFRTLVEQGPGCSAPAVG